MILSALAAGTPSGAAPHGFKTRHGREGFHPLIRRVLFSLPTDVGCYICNISARRTMILSALAAETPSGAAPHGFKTRHGRGGYHTLIKHCLVLLPTDVGSYNPPPLEDQRPRWHIGRRLALIPFVFDLQNVKLNKFVEYGLGFCISTLKRLRQKSERIEDFDLLARAKECPEEYLSVQICHPPISFMRAKECPEEYLSAGNESGPSNS
ncbi:hypothetical protein QVD17_19126 [Tagetes erecta]|uniref:Uncharacterized protein n=1 Tax=Tagetes erecta TaxID=13708 RepID=A0AAD8KIY9_TARER|nr:hypothetical protein QVD17_19126 [Tagetes erecta]